MPKPINLDALGISLEHFEELEEELPKEFVHTVAALDGWRAYESYLADDRRERAIIDEYVDDKLNEEGDPEADAAEEHESGAEDREWSFMSEAAEAAFGRCLPKFRQTLEAYQVEPVPQHMAEMQRWWDEWLAAGGTHEFACQAFVNELLRVDWHRRHTGCTRAGQQGRSSMLAYG